MPEPVPGGTGPSIVVTGMGAVSAFGWGTGPLWQGLRSARAAITPFDRFDATDHRTHLAAQVPHATLRRPAGSVLPRRASHADRFATAAAHEAVAQARLDLTGSPHRAGVFFGSSTGGLFESEQFVEALVRAPSRRQRRSLLESQQCNGPGDAVARMLRVQGPVETVSSACASGAMAIGRALQALRAGEVEVVLAGGADSLCRITYAGFNALRAVDQLPCRPFRSERAGLSLGEGAAVLVLETLEGARARGTDPIAVVCGAGASCDAGHMTAPDAQGRGAARAIEDALAEGRVSADDVDFVNAHGTGTPLNDAAEWEALRTVFGPRATSIPLTSTKALLGHLLGSAGALEAVATVLCLRAGEVHPVPDDGTPDPEIPVDLVTGRPRVLVRSRHALSLNLAFGGANAALVFKAFQEVKPPDGASS